MKLLVETGTHPGLNAVMMNSDEDGGSDGEQGTNSLGEDDSSGEDSVLGDDVDDAGEESSLLPMQVVASLPVESLRWKNYARFAALFIGVLLLAALYPTQVCMFHPIAMVLLVLRLD